MNTQSFLEYIQKGYACKSEFITIGAGMLNGEIVKDAHINIPLKTINRHGLIAGATGTGKTKTLQVLAENLSDKGVPVLMMDLKGDLSGIAQPGNENDFIRNRHQKMNIPFEAKGFPVELMTISKQNGVRLRATVSEFGPVLFSRILNLNDTQSGIISIIFKYSDDHQIPLVDLKDIKKFIQYITEEGKAEFEREYGRVSASSTGAILRKIIELEQQGADLFFGETSFDVSDLMRIDSSGRGYINIIRLTDIQDRPKLFSTFVLQMLAEIYATLPEQGDSGRPELVIFIDEAHLVFKEASKTLLDQIENMVKLIRSKGVGIYFVTQNPNDIPNGVLSQLGLKIQHALRAFTANDRKAIKSASENYPISEYYKTDELITQLGTGEALVTALNEKGIPTPLAAVAVRAPMSRMDILNANEIETLIQNSKLAPKYAETIDRDSAYEILNRKMDHAKQQAEIDKQKADLEKERAKAQKSATSTRKTTSSSSTVGKQITKTLTSATFMRGVFGILNKLMK